MLDASWRNPGESKMGIAEVVNQHVACRRLELGRAMARRTRVYLDTRYWILLRDVCIGRRRERELVRLYEVLRTTAEAGTVVCPVEAASFLELFGQRNRDTRQATASLMDRLSGGVCIAPPQERRQIELRHFLRQLISKDDDGPAASELVWSRVGNVLGEHLPYSDTFSAEENTEIQIGFYNHLWSLGIVDILDTLGDAQSSPMRHDETAELLNLGKDIHATEMRSLKRTYLAEVSGILDVCAPLLDDFILEEYKTQTGTPVCPTPAERAAAVKDMQNVLLAGFRKGARSKELPFVHSAASLHAAMRWDRQRRFRPNDFMDFQHANAALPYCQVFLTERPLHALIESVGLATDYNTTVVADHREAANAVEAAVVQVRGHGGEE